MLIGPRQLLAGCSKFTLSLTGVISGLTLSLTLWSTSADVGAPASTEFQSRSMVCAPMSPIWPTPKSRYIFQNRQFNPADPPKYCGLYGWYGEGPIHCS